MAVTTLSQQSPAVSRPEARLVLLCTFAMHTVHPRWDGAGSCTAHTLVHSAWHRKIAPDKFRARDTANGTVAHWRECNSNFYRIECKRTSPSPCIRLVEEFFYHIASRLLGRHVEGIHGAGPARERERERRMMQRQIREGLALVTTRAQFSHPILKMPLKCCGRRADALQ